MVLRVVNETPRHRSSSSAGVRRASVTALLLARAGHAVTLLDRAQFPRPKPCGEFVNPGACRLLESLGLPGVLSDATGPAPRIRGWRLYGGSESVAAGDYGVDDRGSPVVGRGVSRPHLDAELLEAARRAGADVRQGWHVGDVVRESGPSGGGALVVTARTPGGTVRLRPTILVGADGLRSIVARRLAGMVPRQDHRKVSVSAHITGVGPDPTHGHMLVEDGLVVGLAATGSASDGAIWNATVVVPVGRGSRELSGDPKAFFDRHLSALPAAWSTAPRVLHGPWASGPFDVPVRRIAGPDFALVGDASGYYDPLTGQGIYRAVRSAQLLAPHVSRALTVPERQRRELGKYARSWARERRSARLLQHGIEKIFARGASRRWVLKQLSRHPDVCSAVIRATGDMAGLRSLLSPRVWLPMVAGSRPATRRIVPDGGAFPRRVSPSGGGESCGP